MRKSYTNIYILDLHGNSKKKETSPDGSPDQNVFDIQQGVSIGIFIKEPGKNALAKVHHAELWGNRAFKHERLNLLNVDEVEWEIIEPQREFYLFSPQNRSLSREYENSWKITDIMFVNSAGIVTARDSLTIKWSVQEVKDTIRDFTSISIEEARIRYKLGDDTRDWQVELAQQDLRKHGLQESNVVAILYRPFDKRHTYYTGQTRGFICMPRPEVMRHILSGENLGLITTRKTQDDWDVFATENICGHKSCTAYDVNSLFPLYIYPDAQNNQGSLFIWDE